MADAFAMAKEDFNFQFTGTYKDNWFGEINLYKKDGKYFFEAKRSKNLKGQILSYKDNMYIVKWDNRSLIADAFITFENKGNKATMKPISDFTDFSYDFQDLEFHKTGTKGGKK